MSNRTQMKGVKKHRSVGHRPKHNKTSVAYRKKLKRLKAKARKDKLLAEYFNKQQEGSRT